VKAPFPYFGGKASVAPLVWAALGQPKHYIDPFFGSGAVLLARPDYNPKAHIETICDKDGFVANVWRALQFSPDETAKWCDWPVNHADLVARKARLLINQAMLLEGLSRDDEWHDPKMAGYWIWAASCWIGSGMTRPTQIPRVSSSGAGVHNLSQIPHVGHSGMGVQEPYNVNIYTWFRELSERMRNVRVVCGDWTRVCGGNWQDGRGDVGLFFDPPYGVKDRDKVYDQDSTDVAALVSAWCLERGAIPSYRIVLAGYEEHSELLNNGWTMQRWKARGGYGNLGKGRGVENRHREVLYFSPHCLNQKQGILSLEPVSNTCELKP
jgi:DNA adenine methylase